MQNKPFQGHESEQNHIVWAILTALLGTLKPAGTCTRILLCESPTRFEYTNLKRIVQFEPTLIALLGTLKLAREVC